MAPWGDRRCESPPDLTWRACRIWFFFMYVLLSVILDVGVLLRGRLRRRWWERDGRLEHISGNILNPSFHWYMVFRRYIVFTLMMNLLASCRLLPIAPLLGRVPMSSPPLSLLVPLMMLARRMIMMARWNGAAITTALIRAEGALMLSPLLVAHPLGP